LGITVISSVTGKASADTSGIITLASATTLVGIIISKNDFGDIGRKMVVSSLKFKTTDFWGAAVRAFIVLDGDKVLGALDSGTGKRDVDVNGVT